MAGSRRRHRDVLVAGSILLGTMLWLRSVAFRHLDFSFVLYAALCFVAAVVAAQIARRMLPELDASQTAIATAVATATLAGLDLHRAGGTMTTKILVLVGVAAAGAVVGAIASRQRAADVAPHWFMLGAGFAGYGAGIVGANVMMIVDAGDALIGGVVVGALLGSAAVALATDARGGQCALGLAAVFGGAALGAGTGHDIVGDMVRYAMLGGVLGAIGGSLGVKVRESRKPAPELPDARVR